MTHSITATTDYATVTMTVTAAELDKARHALEAALYLLDLDCDSNKISQRHRYVVARLCGVMDEAVMEIHKQRWTQQTLETYRTGELPADLDTPPGAPRYPYDNGDYNNCN